MGLPFLLVQCGATWEVPAQTMMLRARTAQKMGDKQKRGVWGGLEIRKGKKEKKREERG